MLTLFTIIKTTLSVLQRKTNALEMIFQIQREYLVLKLLKKFNEKIKLNPAWFTTFIANE